MRTRKDNKEATVKRFGLATRPSLGPRVSCCVFDVVARCLLAPHVFDFVCVFRRSFYVASVLPLHTPWLAAGTSTYVRCRCAVCPYDIFRYASRRVCASLEEYPC